MSTIAVCIVNYNTRDLLRSCLRSVVAESPTQVVVADNASGDGSVAMVRRDFPTVTLMPLAVNVGYGAAANRAIRSTGADHVLLLNADTLLKPGILDGLITHLDHTERPVILGPRILHPDGSTQTSCFPFPTPIHMFFYLTGLARWLPRLPWRRSLQHMRGRATRRVPWVLGAGMAFRRSTFEQLGGFDESFSMYFEEVDLCRRVWDTGGEVRYVPGVEMVHVGGASTRADRVGMGAQYFESLARFYRKHYSRFMMTRLRLMMKALAWVDRVSAPKTGNEAAFGATHPDWAVYRSLLPEGDGRTSRRSRAGLTSQPGHQAGGEELEDMGQD